MLRRSRKGLEDARRVALVAAAALGAIAATGACEETASYVYTARRYDPDAACLEPYRPVEVVDGPGAAATCRASCIAVGEDVFVTAMCPPLPLNATELDFDSEVCVAARGASSVTCGEPEEGAGGDGAAPSEAGATEAGGGGDGAPEPELDAGAADARDGA